MYTYAGVTLDPPLIAIAAVICVAAVSVSLGVYMPVLRSNGRVLRGFTPHSRRVSAVPYVSPHAFSAQPLSPPPVVEDLDHAALAADQVVQHEPPTSEGARAVATCPRERPEVFSVLIVDDNAINRHVLELILDSAGVAHASVENGLEAVEAMAACAYDAILMDLQMPVMDGFEATRRIREMEAQRGDEASKIIVVSANCLDEHVATARQAGADQHLAKPISAAVLLGEVQACAQQARLAA